MEMAKTIKLHTETDKDTYQVGDDITVQIRDESGNPIEGAEVQTSDGVVATTDVSGETIVTTHQPGFKRLTVDKADRENVTYNLESVTVRVTSK